MMNSNTLKLIIKPLNKLLFVLILITAIYCEGKPTRQDLKNAATIGRTLRNNKSSTSQSFKHYPQSKNDGQDSYTVQKHILKSGETLQDLAVQYGTDRQSIQQANGIKNLNELKDAALSCVQCGQCRVANWPSKGLFYVCPVYKTDMTSKFEPFFARGKNIIIRGLLWGDLELSQEISEIICKCEYYRLVA